MRNLFSRKTPTGLTGTPLDVLTPVDADAEYDTLDAAGLVRHTPILAQLVAEWRTRGDIPAGVIV